ncbi:MAG: Gfo/Idh/MocA family oxidoreductase [Deltaproteobacteria bacterium]|nr:Gfo/Idh/MocA family oxidoreductase [Candidatus Zymogenaceae bacterium]
MDANRTLRVGIVGLGLAARAHLAGCLTHSSAEVAAICDSDPQTVRKFANETNITKTFTSYEEMLKEDLDIVDLCTPTYLHSPMTKQAAESGKHVHCEKPFCRSIAEGQPAIDAVKKAGVKLLVGETYVFTSSHIKARELIEAGEIGRPLQIRQRFGKWNLRKELAAQAAEMAPMWRVDPVKSGGGPFPWLFDHAVHLFAAAKYLMQDIPVHEVYAVTSTTSVSSRRPLDWTVYQIPDTDIPIITWKYADSDRQGLWARAETLNGKYDYMTGFSSLILGERGAIEVLGEGGANLWWEGKQQHIMLFREGKEPLGLCLDEGSDAVWESGINYYPRGHMNQVHHLIESILHDTPTRYGGQDGMEAVRCTLATIRSAKEGRPVTVEEISPEYTAY